MKEIIYSVLLFVFSPFASLLLSIRNIFVNKYCVYLIGAFFSVFGAFLPPTSDAYRYRELYYSTHIFTQNWSNLWTRDRDFLFQFLSSVFNSAGVPFEYFKFLLLFCCYSLYSWMFLDIVKNNPAISDNKKTFGLAVLSLFLSIRFFTLTAGIRFGVASTIVIVAIYLFYKKAYVKSVALYVISITMHYSMLVILPFAVMAVLLSRVSIPITVKYVIILVLIATSQTAIGQILTYFFPEINLIAGGVSTYIEGHWGTAEIMKSASFGGLIFTLVRILPVIPLTIIVLKRTEADRFLADISFLLIVLLCVSFSSITLLLRYSNVTIAILFVVLLLTTTDSQKALNELRISLLSFIIMFGCYAYTQRATLARFELHYRSIISPITLIGDYKYTDEWVQENLDSKGEYYQR